MSHPAYKDRIAATRKTVLTEWDNWAMHADRAGGRFLEIEGHLADGRLDEARAALTAMSAESDLHSPKVQSMLESFWARLIKLEKHDEANASGFSFDTWLRYAKHSGKTDGQQTVLTRAEQDIKGATTVSFATPPDIPQEFALAFQLDEECTGHWMMVAGFGREFCAVVVEGAKIEVRQVYNRMVGGRFGGGRGVPVEVGRPPSSTIPGCLKEFEFLRFVAHRDALEGESIARCRSMGRRRSRCCMTHDGSRSPSAGNCVKRCGSRSSKEHG